MGRCILILVTTVAAGGGAVFISGCESDLQGNGFSGLRAAPSHLSGNGEAKAEVREVPAETGALTVRINNSDGSVVIIRLRRHGSGYVGPRGEYYENLPTEAQLRPVYGF